MSGGIAAGWYPDPAQPDTQRYWDGQQWVGDRLPVGAQPPPGPVATVPAASWGPSPAPGEAVTPATVDAAFAIAPVGYRLAARLIDGAVLLGLNLVVNGYFVFQLMQELTQAAAAQSGGAPATITPYAATLMRTIFGIATALWFAYEIPAMIGTGQTLGKRLVGIRVVTTDGAPIGFGRAFQRWAIAGLPTLFWPWGGMLVQLVDAAWCLWDRPNRQCLHDKSASTVVVTVPPEPTGPTPHQH
jgi:uncharacterized RDD family membrane protein YckC